MKRDEKITALAFGITVSLWVFGASYGINSVAAAIVGLFILLVTGVITWKECLNNNGRLCCVVLKMIVCMVCVMSHVKRRLLRTVQQGQLLSQGNTVSWG